MEKTWYRLDTAALIFPAIARRDWSNAFRLSVTLRDEIDPGLLRLAAEDLTTRFPSFFVTLRKGFFWYYLEENKNSIEVREDYAYPLTFMSRRELRKSCIRILYYRNRIAVEFFHAVTDGTGGSIFIGNLAAAYIRRKYGTAIPTAGVLKDLSETPPPGELEDSFLKNAVGPAASRKEAPVYRLHGTDETDGFRHLTTGILRTEELLAKAHEYSVSVTAFLAAVMCESIIAMQNAEMPEKRRRPVKITIPVDLRRLYKSRTLRNFALVLNVGADPRYGEWTLAELCRTISHQLLANAIPQNMAGQITANVEPQRVIALRLAPLGLKTFVMDQVYRKSGEGGGCINISNLGNLALPGEMSPFVERAEFIIGPQRSYPNNCSVLSFNGKTCINMIRNIQESELERRFFSRLVELGIAVDIESNRR